MGVSPDKQIITTLEETIPKLAPSDQEKLLAFSEGIALAVGFKLDQPEEQTETEQ